MVLHNIRPLGAKYSDSRLYPSVFIHPFLTLPKQAPLGLSAHCSSPGPHLLDWWKDPGSIMMGVPFVAPQPSISLVSDASDVVWEAQLDCLRTQGLLVREFRAVRLACQAFLPQISVKVVQVLTDNATTMFCIYE